MLRFLKKRWPIIAVVLVVLIGAGAYFLWRNLTPVSPSAFYTPPPEISAELAAAPGSIVRMEQITENVPAGAVGYRILYTTAGVNGEPVVISGVVAAPAEQGDTPRPVLAFAQGTIGNKPECAISHTGNPFGGIPGIEQMIAEGYVVAATDYIGRGTPGLHPYLIGEVAAKAVLDSVRAARQLDVNASENFVVWGRSQGGHTSLWTAQLAETYAPELNLIAAAASAPAIDLEGILRYGLTTRSGAVVITYALAAWSHYFDGIELDELVRPEFRATVDGIADTCLSTPLRFLLLGELPTPERYLAVDPFSIEEVTALLENNTPAQPINVPLLITHGTSDTLIPFEGSENEFLRRCEQGENVQLLRFPGVEHDAAVESATVTLGWFNDRVAGRETGSNCPA